MNLKAAVLLDVCLAVLRVTVALVTEKECTLAVFQGCMLSLQSVTQGNDVILAVTKQELEAICRTLEESMQCVDNHMKHCFTLTQRKVFNQVVGGSRQFLSELCVSGPIQETYLRYAACFKNISLSEDKCALKYKHLIELSEKVEEKNNVDEGLRETCCAFNEFVMCKQYHVLQDCGRDAAEFQQRHLDRISSHLIHEHCAHYTYGDDTCASDESSPNNLINSQWLYILSAGIIWLWTNVLPNYDIT